MPHPVNVRVEFMSRFLPSQDVTFVVSEQQDGGEILRFSVSREQLLDVLNAGYCHRYGYVLNSAAPRILGKVV